MKKILPFALLLSTHTSFSQNCDDYYYFQPNKTVEVTITNKKGKETGKNVYAISDVKKSGGTVSAVVNSEFFDTKGKSITKSSNNMKCVGGVIMMDMKMFISSAQQEQMGSGSANGEVYLSYPSNMKVGDALEDGDFSSDLKMQNGIGGRVEVKITNRKVEGKESVTTPAGTWDCFKISYHSKVLIKIVIGIPVNVDIVEWYAPGFGVVKTESGGGSTEITSIK